jgi:hypothetical protein
MKYQTMINMIAGAGLVLGPLSVAASGFGGGWMRDKDTGTLYYSLAPTPERHPTASHGQKPEHLGSFGGGWVQDKVSGTAYYLHMPTLEKAALVRNF